MDADEREGADVGMRWAIGGLLVWPWRRASHTNCGRTGFGWEMPKGSEGGRNGVSVEVPVGLGGGWGTGIGNQTRQRDLRGSRKFRGHRVLAMSGAGTGKKGGRGVGVVKPHGRGEPCVWAEELRGWRRSLQDAPRGGKELETVEGRGSAPMRAGPRRGEGGEWAGPFWRTLSNPERAQGT